MVLSGDNATLESLDFNVEVMGRGDLYMGMRRHIHLRQTTVVGRCLGGLVLLLAVAIALAACGTKTAAKSTTTTTIAPQSLAGAYVYMSPSRSSDLDHPYIKGKIVIVDKGASEVGFHPGNFDESLVGDIYSDGYRKLLAGISYGYMRLIHPSEVGTVIWVACRNSDAGWSYTDGLEAYNTTCMATVIDKAKNLIVGVNSSYTVPANQIMCPATGSCNRDKGYGGFADEYFARWIEHLPRK